MDQFDRAQEMDAYYRRQALQAMQRNAAGQTIMTNTHCEDCGDEIPAGRRQAAPGCTRCRDCQQIQERT